MKTGPLALFGHFRLEARLGKGGMAEVFRARWLSGPRTGQLVAVKRLLAHVASDPQCVDLFVSEADLGRYLQHPHIVQVLESGNIDDTYYIAMEYLDGRDLGQLLSLCAHRRVRLPVDVACFVTQVVAEALYFAHNAQGKDGRPLGIIHCDVTPSNVFISNEGVVKLADFGVAQNKVSGRDVERGMAGKPSYFAPEQVLGEELTPAIDIFALGVIMYEMLTNQRPFVGKTVQEICERIVQGKVDPPSSLRPEISDDVDEIVLQSVARRLPNRQDSMMDQLKALVLTGHVRYDSADLLAEDLRRVYDPKVGSSQALASLMRGLFPRRAL